MTLFWVGTQEIDGEESLSDQKRSWPWPSNMTYHYNPHFWWPITTKAKPSVLGWSIWQAFIEV
jgi:hypothetical protein